MEPFRPCVDWRVFQWLRDHPDRNDWQVSKVCAPRNRNQGKAALLCLCAFVVDCALQNLGRALSGGKFQKARR